MSEHLFFDERTAATFRAAAECILPPEPGDDFDEVARVADRMIAARPEADRGKLRLFLRVLEWLPLLRYARPFTALAPERRARVLSFLEHTSLSAKLRQGFFGIKTFTLMGYYGSESTFGALGYPGPRRDAPFYLRAGRDAP